MNSKPTFNISQDFEIIPPKKGKVYPILVQEWTFIKDKIKAIKIEINLFQTIGSILIGASLSFLGTNIATEFKDPDTKTICWALCGVLGICGLLSFIYGEGQRKFHNTIPNDVVSQMDLIETRYEPLHTINS